MKQHFPRRAWWLIVMMLFQLWPAPLRADDVSRRAARYFAWLQQSQGDSLYAHSTKQVVAAVPAAAFTQLWPTLVKQAGALQRQTAWTCTPAGTLHQCQSTLHFERASLTCQLTIDDTLRLAGIFFRPATRDTSATSAAPLPSGVTEREMQVTCGAVQLPARLTLPAALKHPCPVVVLVHGSGPNDMDGTLGENHPLRDLAYALAERGIATLRYDKRTKHYGANFLTVSGWRMNLRTEVTDDALAALRVAAAQPEVDAHQLYLCGHSLGAMLAPRIVASAQVTVAGWIGLATPARPFWDMLHAQLLYVGGLQGLTPTEAETLAQQTEQKMKQGISAEYITDITAYNPLTEAAQLASIPALLLQGGHDY
ncbi:MAG: alpha/beta hydrolase family protein, partial [Alloprevotella sp.]